MTRRLILLGWAAMAMGLGVIAHAAAPIPLLPLPAQLRVDAGGFTVDAHTPIVLADDSASTRRTGAYLADLIARTRGLHLPLKHGAAAAHAIVLRLDPAAPVANREGYALDVTPEGIRISARDGAGLFYGAVTLWQLLTPDARRGAVQVPALTIRDQPRFAWRGLMLDSARHFQTVEEIERLLDQMAQHKLNTFHWHLTDDQGWRIQIKRYPSSPASARGARRRLPGTTANRPATAASTARSRSARRRLRRRAPHHHRAGDRHAGPRAGRGGRVSATRRHRPATAKSPPTGA